MSVSVNPATNRITNQGTSYDANGNLTAMPGLTMTYDMTNRMISATSDSNGTDTYVYDPAGHRVFRNGYLDFYGVDGLLLGEYSPGWPDGFTACNVSVYFGKRMLWRGWGYNFFTSGETINADRLGSAVYDWTDAPKYFPYGDEPTTTQQNRPKFATYTRDATTALDYAQQRYYASTLGRFTSPDPYQASGGPEDPQSWNRYAYVQGDPVNANDPTGRFLVMDRWDDMWYGGGGGGPWNPCYGGASYLRGGGCWIPFLLLIPAPAEEPPPQPPLECSFSGATIPDPGWGTNDKDQYGYYEPIYFNFAATGGTGGSYVWRSIQQVAVTGNIAFSDKYRADLSKGLTPAESLVNTLPNGPNSKFFDAPGLSRSGSRHGTVVSASIHWTFTLKVTVSKGGKTVDCPTVSWTADLSWDTLKRGGAVASGKPKVVKP
jgi:RHS repeat-associated protein